LERKIFQQYPSGDRAPPSTSETIACFAKFGLNHKFYLINLIFSDNLCDSAHKSEQAATHAELDAGLLGHRSPFWQMVENRRIEQCGTEEQYKRYKEAQRKLEAELVN
jgi:hypothetical protein